MASNRLTHTGQALPTFLDYRAQAGRERLTRQEVQRREAERLARIMVRDVSSNFGARLRAGRAAGN